MSAVKSAQEIEEEADAAGAAAGTSSETAAAEAALATARSKVLSKVRLTPPARILILLRGLTGSEYHSTLTLPGSSHGGP